MNLAISCEDESWHEDNVSKIVKECVNAVFDKFEYDTKANIEICFLFTNDGEIQALNKTFRGVDKPTNVLSFPSFQDDPLEGDETDQDEEPCVLGSVAVAYQTTAREAEEQGKLFEDHLKHLIVHSLLHLLGYDHINDNEAEEMESLEVEILQKINVGDPYK